VGRNISRSRGGPRCFARPARLNGAILACSYSRQTSHPDSRALRDGPT
jgi:hypothetical protein